jgi:GT2 family glycosyltransferase
MERLQFKERSEKRYTYSVTGDNGGGAAGFNIIKSKTEVFF